jgi:hypothetical protein
VPGRAEGPGVTGDGMITIGPDHPGYQAWDEWLKRRAGQEHASTADPAEAR